MSGFFVIPAAVPRHLTNHIRTIILVSSGVAVGSTLGRLELSYRLDLPSVATVVIILARLFFVATLWGKRRRA